MLELQQIETSKWAPKRLNVLPDRKCKWIACVLGVAFPRAAMDTPIQTCKDTPKKTYKMNKYNHLLNIAKLGMHGINSQEVMFCWHQARISTYDFSARRLRIWIDFVE